MEDAHFKDASSEISVCGISTNGRGTHHALHKALKKNRGGGAGREKDLYNLANDTDLPVLNLSILCVFWLVL